MSGETLKMLAFTGMPASGKSVAVQIAKENNIPVVRMGDAVWDETKKQGLKLNDKNVGKVANDMREKHGKDIWAQKTIEKIKLLHKTDNLVIDGIRNREEIDFFKKELGSDFVVIAIHASDETRKKRVLARGRKDDSKEIKDIEERDRRELGWGLGEVIISADITILNEGSIDEFRRKVKKVLQKL
jgi:dephospho-CoA kinase